MKTWSLRVARKKRVRDGMILKGWKEKKWNSKGSDLTIIY